MTIMTAMEGITAPARAAGDHNDARAASPSATATAIPTETFLPYDETPLLSSRRQDGWSAANQRLFLEAIAEGHGVEVATGRVGLSTSSAYAFRRTAKGAAFALGWRAASLVARDAIAETLLVRALEGQVSTIVRADGSTQTRHHHDNGLCMRLLARLDRQLETAADADVKAARLVAQEFDAFLDVVGRGEGPARAGLFLARRVGGLTDGGDPADPAADCTRDLAPIYALAAADRLVRTGVATAQEVDVRDLDPAARANWTAEQWQRADAAGLVALAVAAPVPGPDENPSEPQHCQHSRGDDAAAGADLVVWWSDDAGEYRTCFAPPDDFDGFEQGNFGDREYERDLTDHELAVMAEEDANDAADGAFGPAARDAYFGVEAAADDGAADDHGGEHIESDASLPPPVAENIDDLPRSATPCVQPAPSKTEYPIMTDTSHDIRTLNGLIATTLDSVDGYETAAKDAENGTFAQRFTARATERRQVVSELQAEVARQGGNPEDDGTVLAGAHRVFLDLKSAVTGNDDQAIVNEVERGEDHIKAKYESALEDNDLSAETKSAIGSAWGSVKSGHDEMRDLKHSLQRD